MCVDWLVSPVVDPPGPIVSMAVLAPWAGAENATLSVSPVLNESFIELTDGIGVGLTPPMIGARPHPVDMLAACAGAPTKADNVPAMVADATAAAHPHHRAR